MEELQLKKNCLEIQLRSAKRDIEEQETKIKNLKEEIESYKSLNQEAEKFKEQCLAADKVNKDRMNKLNMEKNEQKSSADRARKEIIKRDGI